jgi:hypothetical protein
MRDAASPDSLEAMQPCSQAHPKKFLTIANPQLLCFLIIEHHQVNGTGASGMNDLVEIFQQYGPIFGILTGVAAALHRTGMSADIIDVYGRAIDPSVTLEQIDATVQSLQALDPTKARLVELARQLGYSQNFRSKQDVLKAIRQKIIGRKGAFDRPLA